MKYMSSSVFNAAMDGDTKVLHQEDETVVYRTPGEGNNIAHIAVRYGHLEFIMQATSMFPNLQQQKNNKGNTPLHEAAAFATNEIVKCLVSCLQQMTECTDAAYLREVNQEGETPFHVALRFANMAAAEELFSYVKHHPDILVLKTSAHKETPLHLYVRHCADCHQIIDNYRISKPKFITQLVEANFGAMFEVDSEKLNPLMRAAKSGHVLLILGMLKSYPHAMECQDSNGRNFLHHLRLRINARDKELILFNCRRMLQVRGIDILSCLRDQNGNTPVHLAILDREFDLPQLILERYVEGKSTIRKELIMNIKNSDGKTIFDLITSELDIPTTLKKLMKQASKVGTMYEELHKAARECNVGVFKTYNDNKCLFQDMNGKNILHIATQHCNRQQDNFYLHFIKEAIRRYPKLMYQRDCNDDTPLHVAARVDYGEKLLQESIKYWHTKGNENNDWKDLGMPPWKVKNLRGHTPFHEAARSCCIKVLSILFEYMLDKEYTGMTEAISDVNEHGETCLHLIAKYTRQPKGDIERSCYNRIVEECKSAAYMRDIDGLTPILRAAQCGQIWLVIEIGEKHPESTYISDYRGRNMWHYLCTSGMDTVVNDLEGILKSWEEASTITSLNPLEAILSQDDDGNTPLHLAIMDQNFEAAEIFIRHLVKVKSFQKVMELITEKSNKNGKSIMNLITCGSCIPKKLKELLVEQPRRAKIMQDDFLKAASIGDVAMLVEKTQSRPDDSLKDYDEWLCEARDGSNILHIALRGGHMPFIKYVLDKKFELIYWKDSRGDTPLHVAATLAPNVALDFYKICVCRWRKVNESSYSPIDLPSRYPPPWTLKNSKGNTFLHEAARFCKYQVVFSNDLVNGIDVIKDVVNNHGETVLHVIARSATNEVREFLENLPRETQPVVNMKDLEGFTPILKAVKYGRFAVAKLLYKHCQHSIMIVDNKGRTALHHMRASVVDLVDDVNDVLPVWNTFYKECRLDRLRSIQNEDGNTALHSAIIEGNFKKVKFLMEKCIQSGHKQELHIINNMGHTVFDLVSFAGKKELQPLVSRVYVKERELMDNMMKDELYNAAAKGRFEIFDKQSKTTENDIESRPPIDTNYFCSQTPGGSNIVHIALRHGKVKNNGDKFIKIALEKHPILSMQPDSNGDTPLHLAAKWKSGATIMNLLIAAVKEFNNDASYVAPWAVKNYKGSFPIHEALESGNLEAAKALLECDNDAASRLNDLGDTALHSFAKNDFSVGNKNDAGDFVEMLLKENNQAAYMRDDEGLTPLLSAARSGRLHLASAILNYYPQSAYLRDPGGRTFLHLLRFTGDDVDESLDDNFKRTGHLLFDNAEADAQRLVQDYEGNTPLHYAIITGNSIAAIVLTHKCLESEDRIELGLVNKQGQTVPDLLALHDVPHEIIDQIQKKLPRAGYLARSSYGIRKTEMKESANALSVVAALLATITFAAAFQVPGGFGEDGHPILLSKLAFIIFSVANTIAMCSSMLCLFLILWVMGIGKMHGSLKILDISIILLRLSFYLTLLAFTTGMFVATAEKSLWMGVLVCVFGTLTFLLTFKISIQTVAKYVESTYTGIKIFMKPVKSKNV